MTDRQSAIHRAKEAYRMWLTNATHPTNLTIGASFYCWSDSNGWTVILKSNGALWTTGKAKSNG